MRGDIVSQGIELMLYGMGTVVLFLALLVLATTAMSGLLGRYFPEAEPVPAGRHARARKTPDDSARPVDPGIVAAISAAIHQHRANNK